MRRLFALLLILPCCVLSASGCKKAPPKDPETGNLVLILPESATPPERAPGRVSKLTVDGKDYSEPRGEKRTLQVTPEAGKDEVKVVFSYWPNTYTNIVRTKLVKLEKAKAVEADFNTEDLATPDLIQPIYVPTPDEIVEQMCKLAKIGPNDVVYDIGCGDGRMVIMAVKKFGAKKGVGIDIEEFLIKESNANAKKQGVTDKVEFRAANALEIKDFSEASVVLLYLGDFLNKKLQPTLKATLKPGSRVVSHRFEMAADWPPEESVRIYRKNPADEEGYKLHLWTIK